MTLQVKICGLSTLATLDAALRAGADVIGLVFHPKSPRFVSLDAARALADQARGRAKITALVVDADDGLLSAILSTVNPDLWQFHGAETFERIRDARAVFGLPIIKAAGVADAADIKRAQGFGGVADHILLDARPPAGAAYPGGHGAAFDWALLSALPPRLPFMLSGGLTVDNVDGAIHILQKAGLSLFGVDVSSGVESALGVKDETKIAAFIAAVRNAA